ncbi:MAG: A/G-specific adenine glycosylase [Eubacteriales bacterium]|nr:A/G-specific adenine glycosylase [Eubacteriales bacterium]
MEQFVTALKCIPPLLCGWYQNNARELPWRKTRDAYAIWVSEIMLQQTRVEAVKGYYARFMEAIPTVQALSEVPEDTLFKLWEGLGYYSRARNLKRAAIIIMEQYGGVLPANYEALLALPGIGPYTAGAVASIAYGIPVPAVDGNVLRVRARFLNDDTDIALPALQKTARAELLAVMPQDMAGTFNQALMELGATVCLPNCAPACERCPLNALCRGKHRAAFLPVKTPKAPRRIEEKTVFVLKCEGKLLVKKRTEKGLLSGLWELPNLPGILSPAQAAKRLTEWNAIPTGDIIQRQAKHVFTHIEWHMRVYELPVMIAPLPTGYALSAPEDGVALPTAFRVCLSR